jgi:hypothetical protein
VAVAGSATTRWPAHDDRQTGRHRVADAAAHGLPVGGPDIDGVNERVAHQAASTMIPPLSATSQATMWRLKMSSRT